MGHSWPAIADHSWRGGPLIGTGRGGGTCRKRTSLIKGSYFFGMGVVYLLYLFKGIFFPSGAFSGHLKAKSQMKCEPLLLLDTINVLLLSCVVYTATIIKSFTVYTSISEGLPDNSSSIWSQVLLLVFLIIGPIHLWGWILKLGIIFLLKTEMT